MKRKGGNPHSVAIGGSKGGPRGSLDLNSFFFTYFSVKKIDQITGWSFWGWPVRLGTPGSATGDHYLNQLFAGSWVIVLLALRESATGQKVLSPR